MAEVEDPTKTEVQEIPAVPETPKESHQPKTEPTDISHLQRFKTWFLERKKWTIPASVLVFILLLAAIPFTRYSLAGLAIKHDLSIKVVDASANTPVSGALVSVGSISAQTDGTGKAVLHKVKPGNHRLLLTKKYYKDKQASVLAPILAQKSPPQIQMTATGRLVKINVVNAISKKTLSEVDIKVAGISAKTDKNGSATIVVPVGTAEQKAKLSLEGYNDADVSVKVSEDKIQENNFSMTPAGKIYFLSKLSGKIDVVKTNLDGTDRQTVLAGTGSEDDRGTVLLASRDWKYLALLSHRAGATATLYAIDTSNDNLSTIDEGNVSFNLVGWSDTTFVYYLTRTDTQQWQPHGQALKSYNAPTKQLLTLDQTGGLGTNSSDYAQETYGQVYQIGKSVVYEKQWNSAYSNPGVLNEKTAGVYSIGAGGSNAQTLKTFNYAAGQTTYLSSVPYDAGQIYYSVVEKGAQSYYIYDNGKVTGKDGIADKFNQYIQKPITYLQSPSSDNTFWADPRDGKNTLFIGDQDGENGKQIAALSDYYTYGWYTDNYLLVSKNSSELYVMSKDGSQPAIKITDYHKPAITFNGYGGGYGGL